MLNAAQKKALNDLSEPGRFRVLWKPDISHAEYLELRDGGYIVEHWTWASSTRPDVGITEAGVAARAT